MIGGAAAAIGAAVGALAGKKKKEKSDSEKKARENKKFKMRKAARRAAKTLSPRQETRARRQRARRRSERFPGLSRAEVSAKRAEKGKGKSATYAMPPAPKRELRPGARRRKSNRMKKGIGRYAK